jgi:phosphopentomutase
MAHALNYLKKNKPRFLFISLNDSDEWAHRNEYDRYLQTLRQHDAWVRELVTTLDGMGEYGKGATLLVTTDHGRGDGGAWTDHGSNVNGAEYIWLYGRNQNTRKLGKSGNSGYSHADIRPTIEALLGLAPIQCRTCGHPMREFLTKH